MKQRMLYVIISFIVLYSFGPTIYSIANLDEDFLISIYVVSRHGARAPNDHFIYPKYEIVRERWPNGLSQLTDKGCRQMYHLGQIIRERYSTATTQSLLPNKALIYWDYLVSGVGIAKDDRCNNRDNVSRGIITPPIFYRSFDPELNIRLVSSNKSRTISSAHAFFLGFFNDSNKECLPHFSAQTSYNGTTTLGSLGNNNFSLSPQQIHEVLRTGDDDPMKSEWAKRFLKIAQTEKPYNTGNQVSFDFPFTLFNYHACESFETRGRECLIGGTSSLNRFYDKNGALMALLANYTGYGKLSASGTAVENASRNELITHAAQIEDALACDYAENVSYLPTWVTQPYPGISDVFQKILDFSSVSSKNILSCDAELRKIASGILVNTILRDVKRQIAKIQSVCNVDGNSSKFRSNEFVEVICNSSSDNNVITSKPLNFSITKVVDFETKIINIFMAHDFTLYALLTYLEIPFDIKPTYGSTFVIELFKNRSSTLSKDSSNFIFQSSFTTVPSQESLNDAKSHVFSNYYLKFYYGHDPNKFEFSKTVNLQEFNRQYRIENLPKLVNQIRLNCL